MIYVFMFGFLSLCVLAVWAGWREGHREADFHDATGWKYYKRGDE